MNLVKQLMENEKLKNAKENIITLRAIDFNATMVGREYKKEDFENALKMARDYATKNFMFIELFTRENNSIKVLYHSYRDFPRTDRRGF